MLVVRGDVHAMTQFVLVLLALAALWALVRYVLLEQINRRRHAKLAPLLGQKTYLFTRARLLVGRISVPVIASLTRRTLKLIYPIPFASVRTVQLIEVKKLAMDTFLPWGTPLDQGRVVNVHLKSGAEIHFHITDDIEGWRDWIQSYGFKA